MVRQGRVSDRSQHFWPHSAHSLPDSPHHITAEKAHVLSLLSTPGGFSAFRRTPWSPWQDTSESTEPDLCSPLQRAGSVGSHLLAGHNTPHHSRRVSPPLRREESSTCLLWKRGHVPIPKATGSERGIIPIFKAFLKSH